MNTYKPLIRAAVQGVYDLQQLRIASGLRLCANFRSKLQLNAPRPGLDQFGPEARSAATHVITKTSPLPVTDDTSETAKMARERTEGISDALKNASEPKYLDQAVADIAQETENLEEATKLLDQLRDQYRRLTDGIASPRGQRRKKEFKGLDLISTEAEKVLCGMYFGLEKEEAYQFKQLTVLLEAIPIYNTWLKEQHGVGPAMASVLIAYFDPHKARHVSSFWKYAGLDVGPDGMGRSRREAHLVEREYTDKNGELKTRMSVTYEPFLKTKLTGVLASCFLRGNAQPWREVYDNYKHRLETDPARIKCSIVEWKKRYKADPTGIKDLWPPGRINNASKRYMIKIFLLELWKRWRALEGLEVSDPYPVAKQGQRPHAA